jgi:hypothetical protein
MCTPCSQKPETLETAHSVHAVTHPSWPTVGHIVECVPGSAAELAANSTHNVSCPRATATAQQQPQQTLCINFTPVQLHLLRILNTMHRTTTCKCGTWVLAHHSIHMPCRIHGAKAPCQAGTNQTGLPSLQAGCSADCSVDASRGCTGQHTIQTPPILWSAPLPQLPLLPIPAASCC